MSGIINLTSSGSLNYSPDAEPTKNNQLKHKVDELTEIFIKSNNLIPRGEVKETKSIKKRKIKRAASRALPLQNDKGAKKSKIAVEPLMLSKAKSDKKSRKSSFPLYNDRSSSDSHRIFDHSKKKRNSKYHSSKANKKPNSVKNETGLINHLEKEWKRAKPGVVNVEILNNWVLERCRLEIERQPEGSINLQEIVLNIQSSGEVLSLIAERLEIFQSAMKGFIADKESSSESVNFTLGLLGLLIDESFQSSKFSFEIREERKIKDFLDRWEWICEDPKSKKFVKVLRKAFGNTKNVRKEVLNYLAGWSDPSNEFVRSLPGYVDQIFENRVSISNLEAREHNWIEDLESGHSISFVIPAEIIRCLHTGTTSPMKSLTINQEAAHNREWYESDDDEESRSPDQWQFFSSVLQKILSGLKPTAEKELLDENVELFKELSDFGWRNRNEMVYPPEKDQWLNVLRAMSNSCWGKADDYIRSLFPGLFFQPYLCRQKQGIDLNVEINGPDDFFVQHRRSYAVYYRVEPTSTTVDAGSPLCSIDFSWKVSLVDGCWEGVLQIENFDVHDEGTLDENICRIQKAAQFS